METGILLVDQIPYLVLLIMGYTQDRAELTGQELLWRKLLYYIRTRDELDNITVLSPLPWNANWENVGNFLLRNVDKDSGYKILIAGYSWGGGWGATNLCKQLKLRGLDVWHLVMCDAVYRSKWYSMSWRSLTRNPKIKISDNVKEVSWFFQTLNKPAGHKLVATDSKKTIINNPVQLDVGHTYMDEQPEYQDKVVDLVKKIKE